MQLNQFSTSTKIYLDQINNYIQTGQGYQQLRIHLLKQLNNLDPQDHNSDQTLVPALIQNLRKWLLTDSSQLKSRTIDVLEDIIKHADQVVQAYINSKEFCITLSTAITYFLFNPFTKTIFDQNRLRLCSIVLFYHKKFQQDPSRYFNIFHLYKQLKQKNFNFPSKTFIEIPKLNQFKKIKPKTQNEKDFQSDRIGVTFDSIIEFVQESQKQFKNNKSSCANTQFVRALKTKAKTLFDLAQNSQGLELNSKQKQHAKQLYKQIRTMLKQIQKISEQKIKQQKIKSQKQFAQQKIQQISPNKKREFVQSVVKKFTDSEKKMEQKVETSNLLDDIIVQQIKLVRTQRKKVQTPKKHRNQTNLLDDDSLVGNSDENEFTQYISQMPQVTNINLSSSQKQLTGDGLKPIKKPPKPQQFTTQYDQLIDTIDSSKLPKKPLPQQEEQPQLIQTTLPPTSFSKKSIHSIGKHSTHSQQSDRAVNLVDTQPNSLIFKEEGQNIIEFQNAQHFSKFQLVNNYIDPNKYGEIPIDIDFSDSSSQQSIGSQRVTFKLKNQNSIFQNKNQPYDKTFRTPKKQSSCHDTQNQDLQKDIEKLSLSANVSKQQRQQQLIPNYNFGILADIREVKPYDYNQFQNSHVERSSISNISQDEERKINLTPQSTKKNHLTSLNELSPENMNFNLQKKKSHQNELLEQNDNGQNDEEFGNFQEVPTLFGMEGMTFESEKKITDEEKKQERKLIQKTPSKGKLIQQNEQAPYNEQPLL